MQEGARTSDSLARRDGYWARSISALSHSWARPDLIEKELEARIGDFEKSLAKRELAADEVCALEREIVERREQWLSRWARVILYHDFAARFNTMTTFGGAESSFATLLWAPIFAVYYAVKRGMVFGTTTRLRRALWDGERPDCGYSLVMTKMAFG
ncbi:MAG: hypothetical protein KF805_16420 [Phycisphaeraceae bacterium]|nr:hypothetical protein [Phycisphaeraceae bacterium]